MFGKVNPGYLVSAAAVYVTQLYKAKSAVTPLAHSTHVCAKWTND